MKNVFSKFGFLVLLAVVVVGFSGCWEKETESVEQASDEAEVVEDEVEPGEAIDTIKMGRNKNNIVELENFDYGDDYEIRVSSLLSGEITFTAKDLSEGFESFNSTYNKYKVYGVIKRNEIISINSISSGDVIFFSLYEINDGYEKHLKDYHLTIAKICVECEHYSSYSQINEIIYLILKREGF